MQEPNLDRMWRMWIKIGIPHGTYLEWFNRVIGVIREQVSEAVTILEENRIVDWFCFLIHTKEDDKPYAYFDVVFALREGVNSEDFLGLLPSYCLDPAPAGRGEFESIDGIDTLFLKNGRIEEAWRIIGEQSRWIIHMANIHKENVSMPIQQFTQFMHHYLNMTSLGNKAMLILSPAIRF
jgi:hypothetical protein